MEHKAVNADASEYRIDDFAMKNYSFGGKSKPVLKIGAEGPALIFIHEIYGFTYTLARFCRWFAEAKFQVYAPILFGRPDASNPEAQSLGRILSLCISREIHLFAQNRSSPVTEWLKSLARQVHDECGGAGVGVVGMCLTGGFALSLAVDPVVLAPVLAQPGLPAGAPAALGVTRTELGMVRQRTLDEGLVLRGYRFAGDRICPAARFQALQSAFGDAFEGITLPDDAANPKSPMARSGKPPHSVFTGDLIDEPGQPTRQAVDDLIRFFNQRLRARP